MSLRLRDELAACGLADGTLRIGEAHRDPSTLCLLWMVGSEPAMMSVPREALGEASRAAIVAADFADMVTAAMRARGS